MQDEGEKREIPSWRGAWKCSNMTPPQVCRCVLCCLVLWYFVEYHSRVLIISGSPSSADADVCLHNYYRTAPGRQMGRRVGCLCAVLLTVSLGTQTFTGPRPVLCLCLFHFSAVFVVCACCSVFCQNI